jgi:hypothetical protein
VLDTVLIGPILTAFFPESRADAVGSIPLDLVGPDGKSRSQTVTIYRAGG